MLSGYTPHDGDTLMIWDPASQQLVSYQYFIVEGYDPTWADSDFNPVDPAIDFGKSFLLYPSAAEAWTRTFSACP